MIVLSTFGAIPTEVPFTRIALSAMDARRTSGSEKSCSVTLHSVRSFSFATISSALAKKLSLTLNTLISATPSSAACTRIAVAAPPAPRRVIFFPIISTPSSLTALINPTPSVVYAVRTPLSLTIVLHAPEISDAGDTLSASLHIIFLPGMVIFHPLAPIVRSPCTASGILSSGTSNARYV